MAAPDGNGIKATIAANIPTPATPTAPKANAEKFRLTYNAIVDWAAQQIINASTWRKISDSKGSVDETDTVFRTGRTIIGGSQDDNSGSVLQVRGTAALDGVNAGNGDGVTIPTSTVPGMGVVRFLGNLIVGSSEFAFVNSNLAGDGFSFWQMLTKTTKKMLLVLRKTGVGIGVDNPEELLHVAGRVKMFGWVAGGAAPTASVISTGLGTGGTIAMSSTATDQAGVFTIVTGSNPVAGQMARISFSNKVARTPVAVLISASSTSAGPHLSKIILYAESSSALILTGSDGAALPANTTLSFFYQVII